MIKRWTEEEVELIKKLHKEKSLTELSEILNVDRRKLYDKCLKMGIRFPDMWSKEEDAFLIENYKNMEYAKIGKILHRSKCGVQARCRKLGLRKGYSSYKKELNSNYFDTIDDEHKAYWLGFISADGCVSHDKTNKYHSFKITLSEHDKEHLTKFIKDIDGKFDVKIKEQHIKNAKEKGFKKECYKICEVAFKDKKFTSDLLKYFDVNKTENIRIPTNIPSHLVRHYLRGFSDGDGCFYVNTQKKKKEYSIASKKKEILEDIQNEFSKVGIDAFIYNRRNKNSVLHVCSFDSLSKLNKYFYEDATIFLERKKEKSDIILEMAS